MGASGSTPPTAKPDVAVAAHVDGASVSAPGEIGPEPRSGGFDVEAMNGEFSLVLMGSKSVVVRVQTIGPIEDRVRILGIDAFRMWFQNSYTETRGPDGKTKGMTWAARWLAHGQRRQFAGIEFFPNPDGAETTPSYLNLWRGFSVVPSATEGSYSIFRDHVLNNVCQGDDALFRWVWAWFAHLLQRPRERIGTALVLRGKRGSGKTKVGEVIGSLVAAHYFLVDDPRYVTGQFNAHMAACLLLQAEEAVWAGDKVAEGRLKGLITSRFQMIEAKGIDPIRVANHVRLMMTSNEDWVVPAGKDERRFCVLDVDSRCAQNSGYFAEMEEQLASGGRERLLHDLLSLDVNSVDLRRIPRTGALLEQKLLSLDSVESWWLERLMSGTTLSGGDTWLYEVPSYSLFDDYIATADKVGVRRKREMIAFGMKLFKLVPNLAKSRPYIERERAVPKRVWCYRMPPLSQCREAFVAEVGQEISWPYDPATEDADTDVRESEFDGESAL
ncbi:primase-helicase family protein [Xanthobacter sp. DSM 24535]|uniref:primase-helicase family protein n=1 Tax=Roseixanthobacter psychrophilus TaxID=3119917 RepID=UPI003729C020